MSEVDTDSSRGFSGKQVLLFVLLAVLVTAAGTYWLVRTYIDASDFKPVMLSKKEQASLDGKLRDLGLDPVDVMPAANRSEENTDRFDSDGRLIAERYSEAGASREISLSEKELNAMVASNPEMARRFAIDLSSNLASAKLLVPVDPEFPIMGGRTIRVTAGVELDYRGEHPVVILRGVSVMGVPLPDAWLGNLKNVDLVDRFGGDAGFWKSAAAGIETMEITDGRLRIQLSE